MIKLTFLGTCSGTEPMPNRHHSSFVMEVDGILYWFDAGENCSHRAHTMGLDLTRVRAVFLSHMHIDHTGGLANLLFTINKITRIHKIPHINNNAYDVFAADLAAFENIQRVAFYPSVESNTRVTVTAHQVADGVVFDDGRVRVTAFHNTHLKETGENGWHAYSYVIEAEGKRIVFSGDVGAPAELDGCMAGGCDALIMETGHHSLDDVCRYAAQQGARRLLLTHHHRSMMKDMTTAEAFVATQPITARLMHDGDVETL
ncbi:MAG: MBL fold metallo-hydrolase [Clostridia bacterium]|nr:MBL fold metallo-hydrolase [Clostridia bacterium]